MRKTYPLVDLLALFLITSGILFFCTPEGLVIRTRCLKCFEPAQSFSSWYRRPVSYLQAATWSFQPIGLKFIVSAIASLPARVTSPFGGWRLNDSASFVAFRQTRSSSTFARLLWLSFHENVVFQVFTRIRCPKNRETAVYKFLRKRFWLFTRPHENAVFIFSRERCVHIFTRRMC